MGPSEAAEAWEGAYGQDRESFLEAVYFRERERREGIRWSK